MHTCTFICLSELDLSWQGSEDISNCSDITFGDANRTLYSFDRLCTRVDFTNPDDDAKIAAAKEQYGGEIEYVDLEN